MTHTIVGRTDEVDVVDGFLDDIETEPRALLIEGEAGIGKKTLFSGAVARVGTVSRDIASARRAGFEPAA